MGWTKFLPGEKTIQSPGKNNILREASLFDHTSDIGMTVCGELTQSIEGGRKCKFHNLNLNIFLVNNYPQHLLQLQSYLMK